MTAVRNKLLSIDGLNIVLILLSLVIAIKLPFALFLFAYAVLGPLHYLTEIAWLKEKNYYSNNKAIPMILIALSGIITVVFLAMHYATGIEKELQQIISYTFPGLVLLAVVLGILSTIKVSKQTTIIVLLLTLVAAVLLAKSQAYYVIFGGFMATVIHVFIFTGAFMLFGAKKSKNKLGYLSVILLLICGISIFFIPIDATQYSFSNAVREAYNGSKFSTLHFLMSKLFYGIDKTSFSLVNELGIRVQAFIAFSYTYHYLNWFSKTNIIGWHKVSYKWLVICALVWVASVAIYYYDYELGLVTLFFLSILHVFLEFPLNTVCFKGLLSKEA